MDSSSMDLRDTRLHVDFLKSGLTRHVSYTSNPSTGERSIKVEEIWRRTQSLGNGTFGSVWLEELLSGNTPVRLRAVKRISKKEKWAAVDYRRELEAMAKFSKPMYVHCFVESYGWYETKTKVYMAMQYLEQGDLQKYLNRPFPESEAREIASQLVEGLNFMHRNKYAHRDLKPANILVFQLEPRWWVKIGDFGISKRAPEGMTQLKTSIGTRDYMAPEVLFNSRPSTPGESSTSTQPSYTFAVDMWALGEICVRLITEEPAFLDLIQLLTYTLKSDPFPPEGSLQEKEVSGEGQDFIRQLMVVKPDSRLAAEDAAYHPWIRVGRSASPDSSYGSEPSETDSDDSLPDSPAQTTCSQNLTASQNGSAERRASWGNTDSVENSFTSSNATHGTQQHNSYNPTADWPKSQPSSSPAGPPPNTGKSPSPLDDIHKQDAWRQSKSPFLPTLKFPSFSIPSLPLLADFESLPPGRQHTESLRLLVIPTPPGSRPRTPETRPLSPAQQQHTPLLRHYYQQPGPLIDIANWIPTVEEPKATAQSWVWPGQRALNRDKWNEYFRAEQSILDPFGGPREHRHARPGMEEVTLDDVKRQFEEWSCKFLEVERKLENRRRVLRQRKERREREKLGQDEEPKGKEPER
ncbi:kinase-like domain-containing protein [Lasiosphaeris hirsuta]|uniref:non-specific serine/threonine protein kinase n=1 Tax=Lasiosphaeris hirsuta TaxID=260670 RepID=A0AA39ZXH9_9PEZI|nr:kinase-like domain-containing protein [Lasiosphaeris hirsuta]